MANALTRRKRIHLLARMIRRVDQALARADSKELRGGPNGSEKVEALACQWAVELMLSDIARDPAGCNPHHVANLVTSFRLLLGEHGAHGPQTAADSAVARPAQASAEARPTQRRGGQGH